MKGRRSRAPLYAVLFSTALLSLSFAWLLSCDSIACLQLKAGGLLFAVLPFRLFRALLPFLVTHPPSDCYIQFDELPDDTRRMIKNLTLQVYDPSGRIRTRFNGPSRTLPSLNITIIAIGSTGDALPLVPVAAELQSRGHRVRVATHAQFRSLFAALADGNPGAGALTPVDFFAFDFDPALNSRYFKVQKCFMTCDLGISLQFLLHYLRMFLRFFPAVSSPDASGRPFRSDLVIVTPHASGFEMVAEWLRVPVHAVSFHPAAVTRHTAYAYAKDFERPSWTGEEVLMTHVLQEALPWAFMHAWLNLIRRWKGLRPVPFSPRRKAHVPYTLLYSPSLAPRYDDWGDHVEVVGSCSPACPHDTPLPPSLSAFLSAGPRPVFVTFGSMILDDPQVMTRILVTALNRTGQRGVIQKGWGGLGSIPEGLPASVHLLEGFVPHSALLARCSAVVHHGGSGTTAAVLAAKLPAVVVPVFTDQRFWAERVEATGVGKAIPLADLTPDSLAAGIEHVLLTSVRERAEEMGGRMGREEGPKGAVDSVLARLPADFEPGQPCVPWLHAAVEHDGRWHC